MMENTQVISANPAAANELTGFLRSGRFPHAILLEGPQGSGKSEFARYIAMALLCREPRDEKPCGECVSCKKVRGEIHPDLLVYEGEGKSRAISVDKVREIRAQAYVAPNESDKKILLLKDTQTMLPPAQNALLKVLEEPPARAVFILTVSNRFRLLETVLSRVTVIALEPSVVQAGLEQTENAGAPEESAHMETVRSLMEHLNRGEEAGVLACLSRYEKDRAGFIDMLGDLKAYVLQSMLTGGYKGKGGAISELRLYDFADIIDGILESAGYNVSGMLLGCALCARLSDIRERY